MELGRMDKMDFRELLLSLAVKNDCTAYFEGEKANIFCRLTEHMLAVNESFNLTAIKEPSRIALLHYIDSLKGADVFSEGAKIIDIGAGAGFPSLPLAIARPDLEIIAVDSTAKRMRYVEETAKMLGLSNIKTVTARAEDLGKNKDFREKFDFATARAVASLPVLCELCLPLVKVGGFFAAMKGRGAQDEIDLAKNAIKILGGNLSAAHETPLYDLSGEKYEHTSLLISKERQTPAVYPRLYTKIAKSPL